jgi:hypothetical protein
MAAPSMQKCLRFHQKDESESICLTCFRTIRLEESANLRDAEAAHGPVCEGDIEVNQTPWGTSL